MISFIIVFVFKLKKLLEILNQVIINILIKFFIEMDINTFSLTFKIQSLEKQYQQTQQKQEIEIHKTISILIQLTFLGFMFESLWLQWYIPFLRQIIYFIANSIQIYFIQYKKPEYARIAIPLTSLLLQLMTYYWLWFLDRTIQGYYIFSTIQGILHVSLLIDTNHLINSFQQAIFVILQLVFINVTSSKFEQYSILIIILACFYQQSLYLQNKTKRYQFTYKRKNQNWSKVIIYQYILEKIYKNTLKKPFFITRLDLDHQHFILEESNKDFQQFYLKNDQNTFHQEIRKIRINNNLNIEQYLFQEIKNKEIKDDGVLFSKFEGNYKKNVNHQIVEIPVKIKIFKNMQDNNFLIILDDQKETKIIRKLLIHKALLKKIANMSWNIKNQMYKSINNQKPLKNIHKFLNQIINLSIALNPKLLDKQLELQNFSIQKLIEKQLKLIKQDKQIFQIKAKYFQSQSKLFSYEKIVAQLICNMILEFIPQSSSKIKITVDNVKIDQIQCLQIQFCFLKKNNKIFFNEAFNLKSINHFATNELLKILSPKAIIDIKYNKKTSHQTISLLLIQDMRSFHQMRTMKIQN